MNFMVWKRRLTAYFLRISDYARRAYTVHRVIGHLELVAVTDDGN